MRWLAPYLAVLGCCAWGTSCREIPITVNEPVTELRDGPPDDRILRHVYARFVRLDDRVDYAGIAAEPEALEEYLGQVASTDLNQLDAAQLQVFWINAYNALFLRAVTYWHPLRSVRRFPAIDRRVVLYVGDEALTLAGIRERKILAGGDRRALFALRTGSQSGPVVGREPLVAKDLENELRARTRDYLMDTARNDLSASDGSIELSRLFDRYSDLFGSNREGLLAFLIEARPGLREALRNPKLSVRWKVWDERLDESR